jgi:predicted phage terminase large subunit-like protein
VIQSPYYKALQQYVARLHPEDFPYGPATLSGDQNAKERYENNYNGYRLATSVDGAATGEGGDYIIIDDPNNVKDSESDAVRTATNEWFDESMQSRLNNPHHGAFIVIQQRTHEDDLSGHIDEKYEDDYVTLRLPARWEGETIISELGWEDPRTVEGEPLWPEFYDDKQLQVLEKALGEYAAAGQLQQRPAPREGGMFKIDNFTIVDVPPAKIMESCRYWDKAGTDRKKDKRAAYTSGVHIARLKNGQFIILDVERGQWDALRRERIIKNTAILDGVEVPIWIEQEPGSGGKESAQNTVLNLAGFRIAVDKPSGDKTIRAEPLAAQVNSGNVLLKRAAWNKVFIAECQNFPNTRYKDQVDSASAGFNKMVITGKKGGTW